MTKLIVEIPENFESNLKQNRVSPQRIARENKILFLNFEKKIGLRAIKLFFKNKSWFHLVR